MMNETIKAKTKGKNEFCKQYIENGRFQSDFFSLETLIIDFNELISSIKALYHEKFAEKVNNSLLQAKKFWSIIKTFYNE